MPASFVALIAVLAAGLFRSRSGASVHLLRRSVAAHRALKPRRQSLSRWKPLHPQHRRPAQQMTSSRPRNVRRVHAHLKA